MREMTQEEINASLFDECERRGDLLERERALSDRLVGSLEAMIDDLDSVHRLMGSCDIEGCKATLAEHKAMREASKRASEA